MSKAVLVRGAFAIQCNSPDPPVWLTVTACSHACSHYHSPVVMTATVQTSDLAKRRQDDVCCRRVIRRWKAWLSSFPSMCGAGAVEQKKVIHSPISSKCTVQSRPRRTCSCTYRQGDEYHMTTAHQWNVEEQMILTRYGRAIEELIIRSSESYVAQIT